MIDKRDKEKYEDEMFESENDIAMSGELQNKKQMVDMFEKMVSPEYQEERRILKNRKQFIKRKTFSVGL
jgi:hypothetical protein